MEQILLSGSFFYFILYAGILAINLVYSFIIIYHLIRFGVGTQPKTISLVFFVGLVILMIPTVVFYLTLNMPQALEAFVSKFQITN